MKRALLWLLGGVVAFVLLVVAIAPELLSSLDVVGGVVAITIIAVVPAAVVALIFVSVRRRREAGHREGA